MKRKKLEKSTKYKHVIKMLEARVEKWYVNLKGVTPIGFLEERDAAKAVDRYLISIGKPPVNVLKRK